MTDKPAVSNKAEVVTASVTSTAGAFETPNVFVDTNVFRANQLVYDDEPFKSFSDYAASGDIRVFETRILIGEIHGQIDEVVNEAAAAARHFRTEAAGIRQATLPEVRALFKRLDKPALRAHFVKHLDDFRKKVKVVGVSIDPISVGQIVDDYFAGNAPFEPKKRDEFPDAITILALDRWCRDNDARMYVVSADEGFRRGAARTSTLIPLERMGSLLELVAAKRASELVAGVRRWVSVHQSTEIMRDVSSALEDLDFVLADADGDVDDIVVEHVDLDGLEVLAADKDGAELEMVLDASIVARLDFKDPDDGIWDSEDKVYIWQPTIRKRIRHQLHSPVRITLVAGDEVGEWEIDSVSVDHSKDRYVSVEDETIEVLEGEGWESLSDPGESEYT
jgi:hypothetical protein